MRGRSMWMVSLALALGCGSAWAGQAPEGPAAQWYRVQLVDHQRVIQDATMAVVPDSTGKLAYTQDTAYVRAQCTVLNAPTKGAAPATPASKATPAVTQEGSLPGASSTVASPCDGADLAVGQTVGKPETGTTTTVMVPDVVTSGVTITLRPTLGDDGLIVTAREVTLLSIRTFTGPEGSAVQLPTTAQRELQASRSLKVGERFGLDLGPDRRVTLTREAPPVDGEGMALVGALAAPAPSAAQAPTWWLGQTRSGRAR